MGSVAGLKDLLYLVPSKRRAELLALVTKNEEADQAERAKPLCATPWKEPDWNAPGHRYWHTIMRLRSLVVQVLVRRIRNNHSPEEAAEILFAPHRYGNGSGLLEDYLRGLPRQRVLEAEEE